MTTLVASVKQYAVMREQWECQDLHEAIEYMNERHKKACVNDGTQTEVDGRSPGTSRNMSTNFGSWTKGSRRNN